MGFSKVAADRILLDLKGLLLSLMILRIALQKKQDDIAQSIIKSIRDDIEKINRSPHLLGSFEAIYRNSITLKEIETVLSMIEKGEDQEAEREIKKLNSILGEKLSEGFSTARYYPTIRPINI